MDKSNSLLDIGWKVTAKLALVVFILFLGNAKAQQVMQLAPGQAPSEQLAMSALRIKPNETLKIENLKINDQNPPQST